MSSHPSPRVGFTSASTFREETTITESFPAASHRSRQSPPSPATDGLLVSIHVSRIHPIGHIYIEHLLKN
ncbi:unnamed protein product [Lactuca virosa]|uniref:Uncharacterized protein n=1 Tax=Lactuca virosa TaxID=75947 RepID=A0AAU9MQD6_9ASTR|nr:unnamed protein product [Lactuca virosa]CAH1424185.1 unnamed protein product [Lactuca virosa]